VVQSSVEGLDPATPRRLSQLNILVQWSLCTHRSASANGYVRCGLHTPQRRRLNNPKGSRAIAAKQLPSLSPVPSPQGHDVSTADNSQHTQWRIPPSHFHQRRSPRYIDKNVPGMPTAAGELTGCARNHAIDQDRTSISSPDLLSPGSIGMLATSEGTKSCPSLPR